MIGQQAQYTTTKNKESRPRQHWQERPPQTEQPISASRLVLALIPLNATRSHQAGPINDTNTINLNSLQHVKRTQHQTSNSQNLSRHSRRSRRIRTNKPRTNRDNHNSRQRNRTTTRRRPPRLIKSSLHKRPHNSHNSSQRSRLSRRKRHHKTNLTNSISVRTTEQFVPRHATLSTLAPANPIRPQNQASNSKQHNHRTNPPDQKRNSGLLSRLPNSVSRLQRVNLSLNLTNVTVNLLQPTNKRPVKPTPSNTRASLITNLNQTSVNLRKKINTLRHIQKLQSIRRRPRTPIIIPRPAMVRKRHTIRIIRTRSRTTVIPRPNTTKILIRIPLRINQIPNNRATNLRRRLRIPPSPTRIIKEIPRIRHLQRANPVRRSPIRNQTIEIPELLLSDLTAATIRAPSIMAENIRTILASLHPQSRQRSPPRTTNIIRSPQNSLLNLRQLIPGRSRRRLNRRHRRRSSRSSPRTTSQRRLHVPTTQRVRPRRRLSIRMRRILNNTHLRPSLITQIAVNRTILSNPRLSKKRTLRRLTRTTINNDRHMTLTARSSLRQHDITGVPTAIRHITRPTAGNIREIALDALLTNRPSPRRPREITRSERLTPLMMRRNVITPRHKRRAIRILRRTQQPTIPITMIIPSPPIRLTIPNITLGDIPRLSSSILGNRHRKPPQTKTNGPHHQSYPHHPLHQPTSTVAKPITKHPTPPLDIDIPYQTPANKSDPEHAQKRLLTPPVFGGGGGGSRGQVENFLARKFFVGVFLGLCFCENGRFLKSFFFVLRFVFVCLLAFDVAGMSDVGSCGGGAYGGVAGGVMGAGGGGVAGVG